MSTSAARTAANRANARHSTGPKTDEGKARVARNRFVHGLIGGRFLMLPWEDRAAFDDLLARLLVEHDPVTPTEISLVSRIAEHHWLRGRALVLQELCFDPELPHVIDDKQFALFLRYETMHERAFHRCLNEFLKLKKTRLESQVGFEPQNPDPQGSDCATDPPPASRPDRDASPALAQPPAADPDSTPSPRPSPAAPPFASRSRAAHPPLPPPRPETRDGIPK